MIDLIFTLGPVVILGLAILWAAKNSE